MRSIAVRCVAVAGLLASPAAWGADIPTKAPVVRAPPAVATDWTGFYINGGGGYGLWAADSTTSSVPGSLGEPTLPLRQTLGGRGWLARVGGGFDYQFHPRIVAGVFGDFDFSNLKGTIHDPFVALSADVKQTSSWAAGARVGWLMNPALLSYFNAGYTSARFSNGTMVAIDTANPTPLGAPSGFATPGFRQNGWFLGGGTETSVGSGWFWRNEYRYAYYGNHAIPNNNVSSPAPYTAFNNINFKPTVQTVTTQLVYKFNPGVPGAVNQSTATAFAANWTGAFVNGGVGYGLWVADETTSPVPGAVNPPVLWTQRLAGKGWLARVGGGYDHQFGPRIVAGVFADADISSLKGSLQDTVAGLEGRTKETWSWAVGARAGWLVAPEVLSYVAAGYTATRFSGTTMFSMANGAPFFGLTTPAFTTDGWFTGGGVEAAIAPGLFWRNEYRYAQYGMETIADTSPNPAAGVRNSINFKPTVQTITTQLVYKFNWSR
ncbi:MAG: outer rane immunogenic protein [Alphaproteobacteria bacterium]|nr:outer rane immunogenic protein [Alphaproteobacteria bacterium]